MQSQIVNISEFWSGVHLLRPIRFQNTLPLEKADPLNARGPYYTRPVHYPWRTRTAPILLPGTCIPGKLTFFLLTTDEPAVIRRNQSGGPIVQLLKSAESCGLITNRGAQASDLGRGRG